MEKHLDKAILVGLELSSSSYKMRDSLLELEALASAADIKTVDTFIQRSDKIYPKYYVGSGKVLEIKKAVEVLDATMVIFDDPLSPTQINNLEKVLDTVVIDRSFLILSIFSKRATSKQSILEVSLAQKEYMLPRLIGLNRSLSRQGGGSFNAKGPGETKLELDRRKLLREINQIKLNLEKISQEREQTRKKRRENKIPIVALAGYTNVGKSSLMNSMSKLLSTDTTEVFEKNMLFATLDTKTKRMQKDNFPPFILIDTVGFIRKLPLELIRSFESTLRDILDADLILLVSNGAINDSTQLDSSIDILKKIKANDIKRINVLTNKDLAINEPIHDFNYVFVSNKTMENIDLLINSIYNNLFLESKIYDFTIPFKNGDLIPFIKNTSTLLKLEHTENGYLVKAILSTENFEKIKYALTKKVEN